jgi:hypothetical protein
MASLGRAHRKLPDKRVPVVSDVDGEAYVDVWLEAIDRLPCLEWTRAVVPNVTPLVS